MITKTIFFSLARIFMKLFFIYKLTAALLLVETSKNIASNLNFFIKRETH